MDKDSIFKWGHIYRYQGLVLKYITLLDTVQLITLVFINYRIVAIVISLLYTLFIIVNKRNYLYFMDNAREVKFT